MPLDALTSSVQAYRAVLVRLYGFHAALEDALGAFGAQQRLSIDLNGRRKARRLLDDVRVLDARESHGGWEPARMPAPQIDDDAQALGILYVVEGSTLGGRIIVREAGRRLGVTASGGASFFAGYAEATGPMWIELCDALAARASDAGAEHRIIASARETFARFRAWIEGMDVAA